MSWKIALDVIEEVRGSIAMYLFIIEEAIQTAGMACYLLQKAQDYEALMSTASWILNNLINPAIDFVNTYGAPAYPLNQAYYTFYNSAKLTMETYIKTAQKALGAP